MKEIEIFYVENKSIIPNSPLIPYTKKNLLIPVAKAEDFKELEGKLFRAKEIIGSKIADLSEVEIKFWQSL